MSEVAQPTTERLLSYQMPALISAVALAGLSMVAGQPLLGLFAFLVVPILILGIQNSNLMIAGVIGIMYANIAVVAVRVHGAPSMLAMMVPVPLMLPLFHEIVLRRAPIVFTSTLPWIGLFMFFQAISTLLSPDPKASWPTLKNGLLEGLIMYVLVTNAIRGRTCLQYVNWSLLLAGGLMGAFSLIQWATQSYDNDFLGMAQIGEGPGVAVETERGEIHQPRVCGPIGEQNRYAQIMLLLVPIGLCEFLSRRSWLSKTFAGLLTIAILGACLLTFSRGAVVALGFVACFVIGMRLVRIQHVGFIAVLGLVIVLSSAQMRDRLMSIPASVQSLNRTTTDEDADGAVQGRATAMLAASRVFAENPMVGVGPGRFNEYSRSHSREGGIRAFEGTREAHCLYLELAAENGILGLFTFAMVALVSLRRLLLVRRIAGNRSDMTVNWQATGFFLAIIAYLASAVFLHFSYARYFWLILACADVCGVQYCRSPLSWRRTTA